MNKRQAKKAFKKKYGVNPVQFDRDLDHLTLTVQDIDWGAIGRALAEAIQAAVKAAAEAINNVAEYINTPEFQEALRKYKEEHKEEQEEEKHAE